MRMISSYYHDFLRPLQGSCDLHFYAEETSTTEVFVYDLLRTLSADDSKPFQTKKSEDLISINDHFAMAQFVFDRDEQKRYIEKAVLGSTMLCQTNLFHVKKAVVKCCSLLRKLNHLRPVSYTHLRAHETLRYLVCRLLLEKKFLLQKIFQARSRLIQKKLENSEVLCINVLATNSLTHGFNHKFIRR